MWLCALLPVLPAVFFYSNSDVLLPALVACAIAYHLLYRWVAATAVQGEVPEGNAADVRA